MDDVDGKGFHAYSEIRTWFFGSQPIYCIP